MKSWKAELLLFFVTIIWGGTFTFTKLGLNDASPFLYLILRFSLALIIAIIIFRTKLLSINKTTLIHGLILGIIFGGGYIFQTLGLNITSVTKTAFITGMAVVITPFIYKLIEKKKVLFWPKIGVVVAFIGLLLFTNPKFDNINTGDLFTLISTFFWAFYIVYMDVFTKGKTNKEETLQLVFVQIIGTLAIIFLAFLIFESHSIILNITTNLTVSILYNGILASFILTLIHTSVQRYTTPVKASLIFTLEPIIASIVAVFALNEFLNTTESIGASILLLGVLISETGLFLYNKIMKQNN